MLKYHSTYIGFREIPDEISLCINISNCPNNCEGCHSPWLKEDVGTPLSFVELTKLIQENIGITCVCFMGGDRYPREVEHLSKNTREMFPNLKTAVYSGVQDIQEWDFTLFNYVKLGPYIKNKGPLDKKTTNQQLLKIGDGEGCAMVYDITYKFWK